MKYLLMALTFGVVVASSTQVEAKSTKRSKVSKKAKAALAAPKGKLETDVRFTDSVLNGKYQTPSEALARVENEKELSDLLGVRKHFKDRLLEASEQE